MGQFISTKYQHIRLDVRDDEPKFERMTRRSISLPSPILVDEETEETAIRIHHYYDSKNISTIDFSECDPNDVFLHILQFLSRRDLVCSTLRINRKWNQLSCSPILSAWKKLDLSRSWNSVSIYQIRRLLSLPRFSRLQCITMNNAPEINIAVIKTISSSPCRNFIREVSLMGCSGIDLDHPDASFAFRDLVTQCPRLAKIEIYGCSIFRVDRGVQLLNAVWELRSNIDFGSFALQALDIEESCRFAAALPNVACMGDVQYFNIYSNANPQYCGNQLVDAVKCCMRHRELLDDYRQCGLCLKLFQNDDSLVEGTDLFPLTCAVCYDNEVLLRKESWIELKQIRSNDQELNLRSKIVKIGRLHHLPPTLKFIGQCNEENRLKELVSQAKFDGHSRAILTSNFYPQEDAQIDHEASVGVFADSGLIVDPQISGDLLLSICQSIWKSWLHVILPLFVSIFTIAAYHSMINSLKVSESLQTGYEGSTVSALEQSQNQSTSLQFILILAGAIFFTILLVVVVWWRCRQYWERIFSFVLGFDFLLILLLGSTVLIIIPLEFFDMQVDALSLFSIVWNFSFIGILALFQRGEVISQSSSIDFLQRLFLVAINVVMSAMVSLTLLRLMVSLFLILPVLIDLVETRRSSNRFYYTIEQSQTFWIAESITSRTSTVPVLTYEVPASRLRIRSADILWFSLFINICSTELVLGAVYLISIILILIFVYPYIFVNRKLPYMLIAYALMWIFSLTEGLLSDFYTKVWKAATGFL